MLRFPKKLSQNLIPFLLLFAIVLITFALPTLFRQNPSASRNQITYLGNNLVKIDYVLNGSTSEGKPGVTLIGLPIDPDQLTTPELLLHATHGKCFYIKNYDSKNKVRLEYSTQEDIKLLDKIKGGTYYFINCLNNGPVALSITGYRTKPIQIAPGAAPNWIIPNLNQDGLEAEIFLQQLSSTENSCYKIVDKSTGLIHQLNSSENNFRLSPLAGYDVYCIKTECQSINPCNADLDKNGFINDIDLAQFTFCSNPVNNQDLLTWDILSCNQKSLDINNDGKTDQTDKTCLDNLINFSCSH